MKGFSAKILEITSQSRFMVVSAQTLHESDEVIHFMVAICFANENLHSLNNNCERNIIEIFVLKIHFSLKYLQL